MIKYFSGQDQLKKASLPADCYLKYLKNFKICPMAFLLLLAQIYQVYLMLH